jgi:hypothetical protein
MRRTIRILAISAVAVGALATASSAFASTTVCASGCPYTSINTAIGALPSGSTILIGEGEFVENVIVNKEDTLKGKGQTKTTVRTSVSNPNCAGGSLCGGTASNIILVEANNVKIEGMTLDGSNPSLGGGVTIEGVKVDARNGIITNHEVGSYSNLRASRVKVKNVFLRGIYQSSENSFNFSHDAVENVQGSEASIAMFSFGSSGVFEGNKVSKANDAISSNWSTGISFISNTITGSASGIHTDNNGGKGGVADLIKANKVSACKKDGYGVFVFAPYRSATVIGNSIKGCAVGIAAFGSQEPGQGPKFVSDIVNGTGAVSSEPTVGAYITTDMLGFGFADVTATLEGSTFSHFGTGLLVTQTTPTEGDEAGGQATVTASPNNQFVLDTTGAFGEEKTVVNAKEDWWGCAAGPNNAPPCTSASGTVVFTPFLTAKP